jgi:mono/diheme cytochrome c family protein
LAHSRRTERPHRLRGATGHAPLLAVAAALLAAAPRAGAAAEAVPGLAFSRRAEPVATRDLGWLREIAPPAAVRVHEPYELREVVFEALPFDRVLDAVYTRAWRSEQELLFTCRDGYQPSVPVARVLAHRAWLAFARADRDDFSIDKLESGRVQRIELGPFYLVWENLDDAVIRQDADYGWPYQLVGIDLIATRDRFPRMSPPAGAPPQVVDGFAAFRVHCSQCHAVNGEGGSIGPELNGGAPLVEVRDGDFLRAWIEDPARIRPGSRMPALNPALPERAKTIDAILAYLRAMAAARTGPS